MSSKKFLLARLQQISNLSPMLMIGLLFSSQILFLGGCGSGRTLEFESSGMKHTISEGTGSVPDDLRKYIYPEGQIAGSTAAHDKEGEHARFISLSASDSIDKVSQWYLDMLKTDGWTIDNHEKIPRLVNISGHKQKQEINVLMAEDGARTTITISRARAIEGGIDEEELERFSPNSLTPPVE